MDTTHQFTLHPFPLRHNHDIGHFLRRTLSAEPICQASLACKVYLDPNFDPEGAFVMRDAQTVHKEIGGVALALARRHPLEDGPDDRDRGWITLFAVAPNARRQGVGSRLFDAAEDWLRARGCTSVWISPYAPGYWTPGVDEAAYPDALAFLAQRGYETQYRPLSMQLRLSPDWRVPKRFKIQEMQMHREQVHVGSFWAGDGHARILDFLRREFPGDWQRVFRETLLAIEEERRSRSNLWYAYQNDTVLGVAQHDGERFGPIGVAKDWRGKGLGALLMYRTLESMHERGLHNAWFMWTDDTTAERLYKPAGFEETRRYAVLRKNLL